MRRAAKLMSKRNKHNEVQAVVGRVVPEKRTCDGYVVKKQARPDKNRLTIMITKMVLETTKENQVVKIKLRNQKNSNWNNNKKNKKAITKNNRK